ncbi:hypothetical protein [Streptomyces toxytricini]|uniref:hypothetical protein n=1 Tax=Streptomyces toxytricini TaxID=67369 RepID=UPI003436AC25
MKTNGETDGATRQAWAAPGGADGAGAAAWLREGPSGYGRLRYAAPPLAVGPGDRPARPSRWGTDRAAWLPAA